MSNVTHRIATAATTNVKTYTSGSFTPAAGDLLVAFVTATGMISPGILTDTQNLGWDLVATALKATSADTVYTFISKKLAANSAMTVTFDGSGDTATGCVIQVASVSGMTLTGLQALRQKLEVSNHAIGTPAPAFPGSCLTGNPTLGIIANATNPAGMTPPTSWTENSDTGYATPTLGAEYVSRDSGFTGTTVTWGSSSSAYAAIIIELNAQGAPTTVLDTTTDPQTTLAPALAFTGTDPQADAITYQTQIDTKPSFDSQASAPAFVQGVTATMASSSPYSSAAFGASTTPGNLIVVTIADDSFDPNGVIINVTDNKGNTFKRIGTPQEGASGQDVVQMWYAYNIAGGAGHTITVNQDLATSSNGSFVAQEFSVTGADDPLDKTAKAAGTSTAPNSGATATLSSDNQLVVAGMACDTVQTPTAGTGYTNLQQNGSGTPATQVAMESKVVAATTAVTGAFTITSTHWGCIVATFRVANTPLFNKLSASDAGFVDITNGAHTDPFTSAEQVSFTPQTNLTNGTTYYWRSRGKDPSGSAYWGPWPAAKTFLVTAATQVSVTKSLKYTVKKTPSALTKGLKYYVLPVSENFEGGIPGKFDSVGTVWGGGTATLDTGSKISGANSVKFGATAEGSAVALKDLVEQFSEIYIQFKVYIQSSGFFGASGFLGLLALRDAADANRIYFNLEDYGTKKLTINGDASYAAAIDIPVDQIVRVEMYIKKNATTGAVKVWLNNGVSASPDYNSGAINTGALTFQKIALGQTYAPEAVGFFWIDDVKYSNVFIGGVAAPVSVTKSLQYTVKKTPTAPTKSLQYTVKTVPTAKTKSLQYEVKKAVAATKSLKYTTKAPVAPTKSLKYTVKKTPTAGTKSLKYTVVTTPPIEIVDAANTTGGVGIGFGQTPNPQARGQGFKTTGSLITAVAFKLNSVGSKGMLVVFDNADSNSKPTGVYKTGIYSFEITNGNLATSLKKFALPVALPVTPGNQYVFYLVPWDTSTHAYADDYRDWDSNVGNPYANGKQSYYDTSSGGSWNNNDSGNADSVFRIYTMPAGMTKSLRYTVKPSVAITKSLRYVIPAATSKTKSLKYCVVKPASATKSLYYEINKSLDTDCMTIGFTTQRAITKGLHYTVKTHPSALTKSLSYAVDLSRSITKSLKYTVKKNAAITKSLRYTVTAHSALTKSLKYTVAKTKAAITKSLGYVLALPTKVVLSLRYVIKSPVVKTKSLAYRLVSQPATVTKSLRYGILIPSTNTKSLTYEVTANAVVTKSLGYRVVVPGVRTLGLQYVVPGRIVLTKSLKYAVPERKQLSKSLTYELRKYPYKRKHGPGPYYPKPFNPYHKL